MSDESRHYDDSGSSLESLPNDQQREVPRESEDGDKRESKTPKWTVLEWLTLIFDGIVAFAALSALYTYRGQLHEAHESNVMQATLNQPDIGTCSVTHVQIGERHVIRQSWKNYGQLTPHALHIDWEYVIDRPVHFSIDSPNANHVHLSTRIASDCTTSDELLISASDRERAQRNNHLFLLGKITYGDHLPRDVSEPHEVHYCAELADITTASNGGWSWTSVLPCANAGAEFDCIDDECPAK